MPTLQRSLRTIIPSGSQADRISVSLVQAHFHKLFITCLCTFQIHSLSMLHHLPCAISRGAQSAFRTRNSMASNSLVTSTSTYIRTRRRLIWRRWHSSEATSEPVNPKIAGIVDQISQLTLLETADLIANLKVFGCLYLLRSSFPANHTEKPCYLIDAPKHP